MAIITKRGTITHEARGGVVEAGRDGEDRVEEITEGEEDFRTGPAILLPLEPLQEPS